MQILANTGTGYPQLSAIMLVKRDLKLLKHGCTRKKERSFNLRARPERQNIKNLKLKGTTFLTPVNRDSKNVFLFKLRNH